MRHILHADRSSLFKKIIKGLCDRENLKYSAASSIEGVFEILKDQHVDLIMTSKGLENESGEDLIKNLNDSDFSEIPIVLVSSDENLEDRMRYFNLGIIDFVLKQDIGNRKITDFLSILKVSRSRTSALEALSYAILDDSTFSQKIITSILSSQKIDSIHSYSNPMDLLNESDGYDVYFIDMVIPGISGEEMIGTIRKRFPDSIIIAISSVDNIKTISYVLDGGADDYIIKPFDATLFMVRLRNCVKTQALVRDLKEKQEALELQARTDGLTGLVNHRYIMDLLEKEKVRSIEEARPLSVLLLDLDFFKKVNDTYGHPVGDTVLRILSEILKTTSPGGAVPARYGGEEFLIVLPGIPLDEAVKLAEILLESVRSCNFPGIDQSLTVSCGAAQLDPDTPDHLVQQADDKLYQSKKGGRDRVSS